MEWLKLFLQMLLFAAGVLVVYSLLKMYVLSKIKINKWIILALAVVALFLPNVLAVYLDLNVQNNIFWVYGPSSLFILFFLWFMDLSGWNRRGKNSTSSTTSFGKNDKKKDVVIRPKAKPNRVKSKKE